MFSTKCTYCRNLISLKTEEVRAAVAEAEAAKQSHYSLHCTKCQRVNKIQVKELKRSLPPEPQPAKQADQPDPSQAHDDSAPNA